MAVCDMCGEETDLLVVSIEGSELTVCNNCAKYGKVIRKFQPRQANVQVGSVKKEMPEEEEIIEIIVPDFADLIRNAREKTGQKQEVFAKKINEKASLVHYLETGKHKPSIELARKLEKALGIKLVEQIKDDGTKYKATKSGSVTIGDIVKIRKR